MRFSNIHGRIGFFCFCFVFFAMFIWKQVQITKDNDIRSEEPSIPVSRSKFPLLLHQMWRDKVDTIPSTVRGWMDGCKKINHELHFNMFLDADLEKFVINTYPRYLQLYRSLQGVFMADMARVLIMHHYGGIYMDLDFYCHRPFRCLENYLIQAHNISDGDEDDILIVSRESQIHASIFRNTTRVVIQDFFMSTPHHPFLKWILEDRLAKFEIQRAVESDSINLDKKPFSFSIQEDLDKYKLQEVPTEWVIDEVVSRRIVSKLPGNEIFTNASVIKSHGLKHSEVIIELPAEVLHPLADYDNPSLIRRCSELVSASRMNTPQHVKEACGKVRKSDFFTSSKYTIAVHMWWHTYWDQGYNMLRHLMNCRIFYTVERSLPSLNSCTN